MFGKEIKTQPLDKDIVENFGDILEVVNIDYSPFDDLNIFKSHLYNGKNTINLYLKINNKCAEALLLKWLTKLFHNQTFGSFMTNTSSTEANLIKELYNNPKYYVINKEKMEKLLLKYWDAIIRRNICSYFSFSISADIFDIQKYINPVLNALAKKTNSFCECYPDSNFVKQLKENTVKILYEEIIKVDLRNKGSLSYKMNDFYNYLFNKEVNNFLNKINYPEIDKLIPFSINFKKNEYWFVSSYCGSILISSTYLGLVISAFVINNIFFNITLGLVGIIAIYLFLESSYMDMIKKYNKYNSLSKEDIKNVFYKKNKEDNSSLVESKQSTIDSRLKDILETNNLKDIALVESIKKYLQLKETFLSKS